MLKLIEVSKFYDHVAAVNSINLTASKNQTTVLIGPSGCGKSTILRLIIGLISPDTGTIEFNNVQVNPETIPELRKSMGYVIQDGGLFPHLTIYDNITVMAAYLGWEKTRIETRLHELVELTRFPKDGLKRFPAQLSGGQKQRVSLMRALMLDPELLLMDEPLGALDPLIRTDLQAELKTIFQKLHKTVIIVTHDLEEAAYLGDMIILMREGSIIQQGALDKLIQTPVDPFVTRFINAQRSHFQI